MKTGITIRDAGRIRPIMAFIVTVILLTPKSYTQDTPPTNDPKTPVNKAEIRVKDAGDPKQEITPPAQETPPQMPNEDPQSPNRVIERAGLNPPTAESEQGAFFYRIEATLDPENRTLTANAEITLFNRGAEPVDHVRLELPANRGANEHALALSGRDSAGTASEPAEPDRFGYIRILDLGLNPAGEALPFQVRNDFLTAKLPVPLAPSEHVALSLRFETRFPRPRRETGTPYSSYFMSKGGLSGRYVEAVHWYPRPGLLRDGEWIAPSRRGLPCTEADFGSFRVRLTLPADYAVEASGWIENSTEKNDQRTLDYAASRVLDFAWTASLAPEPEESLHKGVELGYLGSSGTGDVKVSVLNAAKRALDWFARRMSPYPHSRLAIALAPHDHPTDGLARDMLVVIPSRYPAFRDRLADRSPYPAADVIEGLARSYMMGPLAPDDRESAWFAESLALFAAQDIAKRSMGGGTPNTAITALEKKVALHLVNHGFGLYPPAECSEEGVCRGLAQPALSYLNLTSVLGFRDNLFESVSAPSLLGYEISPLNRYEYPMQRMAEIRSIARSDENPDRVLSHRGCLALVSIENRLGRGRMTNVLRTFAKESAYRRPGPDAFLSAILKVAGEREAAIAETLILAHEEIDFFVHEVECRPITASRGYQPGTEGEMTEHFPDEAEGTVGRLRGHMAPLIRFGAGETAGDDSGGTAKAFSYHALVGRRGGRGLPVTVRLHFQGGKTEDRIWDGRSALLPLTDVASTPLSSVTVDPESVYAIDLDLLNNARTVRYQKRGVLFLGGWFQFWVQNYLNGWAFLN